MQRNTSNTLKASTATAELTYSIAREMLAAEIPAPFLAEWRQTSYVSFDHLQANLHSLLKEVLSATHFSPILFFASMLSPHQLSDSLGDLYL